MTTPQIIKELRERTKHDRNRYDQIRGGTLVKNRYEMKNKQIINYHRGRISAYTDAIRLLKSDAMENPSSEILRWREQDRAAYEAGRKGGNMSLRNRTKPVRTVEYYIGRECAFTEAVTLIERSCVDAGT